MVNPRMNTLAIRGIGEEPAFVVEDVLVMNKIVYVCDSILTESVAKFASN